MKSVPPTPAPGPTRSSQFRGRSSSSAGRIASLQNSARLAILRTWLGLFVALMAVSTLPVPSAEVSIAGFRWTNSSAQSVALFEGAKPVLVYHHGAIQPPPGLPRDRARSSYFHPVYGLDSEVLTDDFPADHPHHRGLFWAWPHVRVGTNHYDLWMLKGIENRFVRWHTRDASPDRAVLEIENGWFVGSKPVLREVVRLQARPATPEERVLDLEFTWTPLGSPITLEGAEGKSYGGLTLRFAPRTETTITTPLGQGKDDLSITRLPWADLSARFAGRPQPSGAAILVPKDHPSFPPEWLTRHYGVLCLGWPGVKPQTFQPNQPIHARYRLWIHRGVPDPNRVERAYREYSKAHQDRNP